MKRGQILFALFF